MPEIDRLMEGLESGLINPFSMTVLLFLAALLSAEVTVRVARVPRIVSLVVAGAAIGWLRSVSATASLMPLPRSLLEVLALVLIFEVGQRVPLSWLRRNPWLLVTSLAESALTFAGVLSILVLTFRIPMVQSVFVGVICMASSPIVVMCVSKDLAARGQIAERALLLSTLSSVYAVLGMQFLLSGYLAANHAELEGAVQPWFSSSDHLCWAYWLQVSCVSMYFSPTPEVRCSRSASFASVCCCTPPHRHSAFRQFFRLCFSDS